MKIRAAIIEKQSGPFIFRDIEVDEPQATVKPGKFEDFKEFVKMIVPLSNKEPGTLTYQFSVSGDSKTATIEEKYKDSESFLSHVNDTFGPQASRFMETVEMNKLYVYGVPSTKAKTILDSFGHIHAADRWIC